MRTNFKQQLLLFVFVLSTSLNGFSQSSNFVTLHGDQFKLQGQDFYPVAMNYIVDIVRDNLGNFHIAPHHSYFASNGYECATPQECYDEIVDDLTTIKNMGFNSIRLVGLGFGDVRNANGNFVGYPAFRSLDVNFNELITPITTSNYSVMFDFIQTSLDAAEDADIKVQLLVGTKHVDSLPFRAPYVDYLEAVAAQFASNSTLYSYDFMNEPLYFDSDDVITKGDVCEIVEDWHNAISDNSTYHLTTIGLATSSEVLKWDPGILKLDFLSFHLYSSNVDVVKSEIKWLSETIRLPWIIGETGYSASTSGTGGQGTLQDQRDFAKATLEMTRDCGGSGYSWWMYQDVYWGDPNLGDHFGLVDHSNTLKPASLEFMAFDPSIQGGTCTTPSNYYNLQGYTAYTATGIVKDQNNQPIKNAVITSWDSNWGNVANTYTQANGTFTLKSNGPINILFATAPGASVYKNFSVSGYQTISLDQFQPVQDLTLSGITVSSGQNYYYEAANSINTTTVTVQGNGTTGGNCNMNGTQVVRLQTGFSAQKGSHFHAYNAPIYPNCNYVSANLKAVEENQPPNMSSPKPEMPFPPLDITQEEFVSDAIRVYPNPSTGLFHVVFDGDGTIDYVEVANSLGQTVYLSSEALQQHNIDLSDKDNGLYILRVHYEGKIESTMIVKK